MKITVRNWIAMLVMWIVFSIFFVQSETRTAVYYQQLVQNSVEHQALVIGGQHTERRRRKGTDSDSYSVRYQFTNRDGRTFEGRSFISKSEYQRLEGLPNSERTIEVLQLKMSPGVHYWKYDWVRRGDGEEIEVQVAIGLTFGFMASFIAFYGYAVFKEKMARSSAKK